MEFCSIWLLPGTRSHCIVLDRIVLCFVSYTVSVRVRNRHSINSMHRSLSLYRYSAKEIDTHNNFCCTIQCNNRMQYLGIFVKQYVPVRVRTCVPTRHQRNCAYPPLPRRSFLGMQLLVRQRLPPLFPCGPVLLWVPVVVVVRGCCCHPAQNGVSPQLPLEVSYAGGPLLPETVRPSLFCPRVNFRSSTQAAGPIIVG